MTSRLSFFVALSFACAALACTNDAAAVDSAVDTDHARRSAESLKGELNTRLQGRDAHYVRTWADYCTKDPTRGGCDTVLRRLKRASPDAQTATELQRDPAVDIREDKAR